MGASKEKKFIVTIHVEGIKQSTVEVQPAETTDGLPYFICKIEGKEVQLRKDGKWEQIWGDLNPKQVEELGIALSEHVETL